MFTIKEELRQKLDAFIRKYYQSQLLKGGIYFIGLGLLYFLLVILLEHIGRFSSDTRLVLLIVLIAGLVVILARYVILPLLGLFRIGTHLGYDRAAVIIGRHFPEVKDKITNTLELTKISSGENRLIQASIDQRIQKLNPIPFSRAVNFRDNLKYWPVLIVPTLIFFGLLLSGQWKMISESSQRIVEYRKEFVPEAPFEFVLLNDDLVVERGESLTLQLTFKGESVPESAEWISEEYSGRFVRASADIFEYELDKVSEDLEFAIRANGFKSKTYRIKIIPVPKVRSFGIQVTPPAYTRIPAFSVDMRSVVDVPEGSLLSWQLNAEATSRAELMTVDTSYRFAKSGDGFFGLEQRVLRDFTYRLVTENEQLRKEGSAENRVVVIRDEFPSIEVQMIPDSTTPHLLYYTGTIGDDYGFTALKIKATENGKEIREKKLEVRGLRLNQSFSGVLNLEELVAPGRSLQIYLQVWDNDGVNGAKSARSAAFDARLLTREEREQKLKEQFEQYFTERETLEKQNEQLRKDIEALKQQMLRSKKASWKDKERLKDLMKKQEQLLKKQAELDRKREKTRMEEKQLKKANDEIEEKEKKIEDLKNNENQKELEELMKELDRLMDKLDIEKLQQKLDKMKQLSEQNQKNEERIDELLKDLQFQKEVMEKAEKLEELGEKMEELSKKDNQDGTEQEDQQKVKEDFEEVKEQLEELKKQKEEFAKETEKQDLEKDQEEAGENLEEAGEQLEKQQQQKANESQQKSGENMKEMSKKMTQSLMQMQAGQQQEDMRMLRQILENLETLSFRVEDLSDFSRKSGKSDPLYRKLLVEQKRLQDGTKIIEDSLVALGNRVPEIKAKVYDELDVIEVNLNRSIQTLEEQNGVQAAAYQQYVMTAANNLALLLDQALQSMQMQMASKMKGNQSCQKPGNGKPSLSNMRKMQGEMGQKMQQLKKGKKEGEGQGKGKGRNGKEIVEMLSRQEQIRRELEEYLEQEGSKGSKGNLQKALEEMKELEKDMLDGSLRNETLERIRQIETRLLESEKAELEQEEDEKREAITAEPKEQLYQQQLEKYLKKKEGDRENMYTAPIHLKNYYKSQSNQFLRLE